MPPAKAASLYCVGSAILDAALTECSVLRAEASCHCVRGATIDHALPPWRLQLVVRAHRRRLPLLAAASLPADDDDWFHLLGSMRARDLDESV